MVEGRCIHVRIKENGDPFDTLPAPCKEGRT